MEQVTQDAPRQSEESVETLVAELEQVELESFDLRGLYFEEVRLCKTLLDENLELQQAAQAAKTGEADAWYFLHQHRQRDRAKRVQLKLALADEVTRGRRREKWLGVALGAAFALGGFVGVLLGVA